MLTINTIQSLPSAAEDGEPILFTENSLNNLTSSLNLSKSNAQHLVTNLKKRQLVDKEVTVIQMKNRGEPFQKFFEDGEDVSYCKDIYGLFDALDMQYTPREWRLFIDGFVNSHQFL